jgi:hypothetical protein
MCYSVEASKISFFINIISTFILYNYSKDPEYKIIAIFFGYIGIVQLYDWILWENQENTINTIVTFIEMVHINIEPLVLAYMIYKFKGSLSDNSYLMIKLYSIALIIFTIYIFNKIKYTEIKKINGNDRLVWTWNQDPTYILYLIFTISYIILGYENFDKPINIIFVLLTIISLSFGLYYKNENAGMFWCKIGSYIPLVFIPLQHII